jgi:hypothetical protein
LSASLWTGTTIESSGRGPLAGRHVAEEPWDVSDTKNLSAPHRDARAWLAQNRQAAGSTSRGAICHKRRVHARSVGDAVARFITIQMNQG